MQLSERKNLSLSTKFGLIPALGKTPSLKDKYDCLRASRANYVLIFETGRIFEGRNLLTLVDKDEFLRSDNQLAQID